MRQRWMLIVGVAVLWTLVLACGESGPLPKIAPISISGANDDVRTELAASTNCAEVGEEVVFTAEIVNKRAEPVTMSGTPPVDIIIQPYHYAAGTGPIQRWTESDQYPRDLTPVLAPGETRTYEWHWRAVAAYDAGKVGTDGIDVLLHFMLTSRDGTTQAGGIEHVVVGVRSNPVLGNGGILCKDMRR